MELVTISKDDFRVYQEPDWSTPIVKQATSAMNGDGVCWSADGSKLAALSAEGSVIVFDANSNYQVIFECKKRHNSIRNFYLSPKATFLVVFERFTSSEDVDNVFVYNIGVGENFVLSIRMKSVNERNWPVFQWTAEEKQCLYMTTNTVKVMHGRSLSLQSPLYSLTIPNISQYSLCPRGKFLAAFFPESNQPAALRVFNISDRSARPRAVKSAFNAQTVSISWNCFGTALTAVFATDSDATSYYGTSSLLHIRIDPETGDLVSSSSVTGEKGGPCHDVCWSPSADEFVAITGPMPAEVALYDGRTGTKRTSFGVTRRNTLKWNAFGRFFYSGGFGNLPGDIDVWDKNRALCLGSARVPCTVSCEWGPDGRKFFASSTFPRMRVDNFVSVINYDGMIVAKIADFKELYAAKWRPSSGLSNYVFQDSPPSPRAVQSARQPSVPEANGSPDKPAKAAAYRPPGGSGQLAELMRKEREMENLKKAVKVVKEPSVDKVAEADGPSASALRNARKKKAAEARKVFESAGAQKGKTDKRIAIESSDEDEQEEAKVPEVVSAPDPAKRIRNLEKKLKEISALKNDKINGKALSPAQIAKIDSENAVLEEKNRLEMELPH